MDEELVRAVSGKAEAQSSTHAALIRKARQEDLRQLDEAELDRGYVERYRRMPENPAPGKGGANLNARAWPREGWDEAWRSVD